MNFNVWDYLCFIFKQELRIKEVKYLWRSNLGNRDQYKRNFQNDSNVVGMQKEMIYIGVEGWRSLVKFFLRKKEKKRN